MLGTGQGDEDNPPGEEVILLHLVFCFQKIVLRVLAFVFLLLSVCFDLGEFESSVGCEEEKAPG